MIQKTTVLKFYMNTINIRQDIGIFSMYFIPLHELIRVLCDFTRCQFNQLTHEYYLFFSFTVEILKNVH